MDDKARKPSLEYQVVNPMPGGKRGEPMPAMPGGEPDCPFHREGRVLWTADEVSIFLGQEDRR